MRSKSKALMDKICSFINEYYKANHQSPSINGIAKAVNVSKTTAYRYLVEMNEKGILSYDGQTIETPHTDKCTTGYFSAPIVDSVRCGDPESEEENTKKSYQKSKIFVQAKNSSHLRFVSLCRWKR